MIPHFGFRSFDAPLVLPSLLGLILTTSLATHPMLFAAPSDPGLNPLRNSPSMAPERTVAESVAMLEQMLPRRTDSPVDWSSQLECLHRPGEPYLLSPCVPPPPCHPSQPPCPSDLIGVRGLPSRGPIYRGPCSPRAGTHDHCRFARASYLYDRFVDFFYTPK